MKPYIIVSYYTKNTPYEDIVQCLINSIVRCNIKYDIIGIDNLGSWYKNTQYKARFLLDMLSKHTENIVWIDADGVIKQYPILFQQIEGDIGVYYNPKELLSGTLYLANNEKVRELVQRWITGIIKSDANCLDQRILQLVLDEAIDLNLDICRLPIAYCQIFDKHKGKPIIEHFQASRKFKQWRNRGWI